MSPKIIKNSTPESVGLFGAKRQLAVAWLVSTLDLWRPYIGPIPLEVSGL